MSPPSIYFCGSLVKLQLTLVPPSRGGYFEVEFIGISLDNLLGQAGNLMRRPCQSMSAMVVLGILVGGVRASH